MSRSFFVQEKWGRANVLVSRDPEWEAKQRMAEPKIKLTPPLYLHNVYRIIVVKGG